jgi:hypothetical protein
MTRISLTPCFSGVFTRIQSSQLLQRFENWKTAEAVLGFMAFDDTPLK